MRWIIGAWRRTRARTIERLRRRFAKILEDGDRLVSGKHAWICRLQSRKVGGRRIVHHVLHVRDEDVESACKPVRINWRTVRFEERSTIKSRADELIAYPLHTVARLAGIWICFNNQIISVWSGAAGSDDARRVWISSGRPPS